MPGVMSVDQWLKMTDAGLLRMRSGALERVDAALKQYNRTISAQDKQALQDALDAFIAELGPGWKSHARNSRGAIADLQKQLQGHRVVLDARELAALEEVKRESRRLVGVLFARKKVTWRNEGLGWLGNRKVEAAYDLVPGGASFVIDSEKLDRGDEATSVKAAKWANDVFNEIVPLEFQVFVKYAVISVFPNYMQELAKAAMPIIGIASASGDLALNIGRLARSGYRVSQAKTHASQHISTREPLMAIRAMIVILQRERNFDAKEALISGAEFGAKVGGLFLDLGTGTTAIAGVAAKAAKLTNLLYMLVRDCYEMKAANQEMQTGRDLRTLFKICPLVGAYYVCCVPTSVLVNVLLNDFGQAGWQGGVEYNVVQHIEPLREQARRVIADHRFVIKGLQRFPGVMMRNDDALNAMYQRFIDNKAADPALGEGLI